MTALPPASTLGALTARFDVFLVDQFGTLHDGARPYDGTLAALRRLRAAGKRVVLLSNSGRRVAPNAERMHRMGVPPEAYEILVTSGEIAWRLLRDNRIAAAKRARTCFVLGRGGDTSSVDGLGLALTSRADAADLVVIAGSDGERRPLADYASALRPAAARGVPALCCNPDRVMLTEAGPAFGAGRIAELYQELGGSVTWVGKPYADIYDQTLSELGVADRTRVIGVGDSIEHDIVGARRAGCAAALVRTGIVAGADDAAIEAECARYRAWPDTVLELFR